MSGTGKDETRQVLLEAVARAVAVNNSGPLYHFPTKDAPIAGLICLVAGAALFQPRYVRLARGIRRLKGGGPVHLPTDHRRTGTPIC